MEEQSYLPRLRELHAELCGVPYQTPLQCSLRLFQAFMDNAPLVAWMKEYSEDAYGHYVYMSRPYAERYGLSWPEAYGKTDLDLWGPALAEVFRRNDLYVLQTGETLETVENGVGPHDRDYLWLIIKFPFDGEQGRRYVGGIGLELPDLERLQERLQYQLYLRTNLD